MSQNELGNVIAKAMSGEKCWSLTNAIAYVREQAAKGDYLIKNSNGKYCLRQVVR